MFRPALSDDEQDLLKSYFQKSPIKLIRLKAQAVLMVDKGIKQTVIADLLSRNKRTIQRWNKDFSERRLASLFSGHVDNENASKLTRAQKAGIKKTLAKPPSEYGLPKRFWDIPQLKSYVKAEFGVVYESVQSYHFLLKFSNLSFKYPDKFDIRRNETKIAARMKQIRDEIEPFLNDSSWEVFASDETGLLFEALTRRAWLKKGTKTVVKVNRERIKQNYIGFLNLKTGVCTPYRIEKGKQEYVLLAVKRHIGRYPNKKICIIWDNATFHKGDLIKEALKKKQPLARVHLVNLPPYAPDTNPIEHIWREGKKETANHQYQNFEITKSVFEEKIKSRKFNYKM